MSDVLRAGAGVAGLGFTTTLAAQRVGRPLEDPLTDRFDSAVVRAGAVTAVAQKVA